MKVRWLNIYIYIYKVEGGLSYTYNKCLQVHLFCVITKLVRKVLLIFVTFFCYSIIS